jgi:hypothetical protein
VVLAELDRGGQSAYLLVARLPKLGRDQVPQQVVERYLLVLEE